MKTRRHHTFEECPISHDSIHWPYPTAIHLNTVHKKLEFQGVFIFTTEEFSIIVPTKTGSTSMREFFEDTKLTNNDKIDWDRSKERIVVLRHPMERYYSGLIEMTRHVTSGGGQSFDGAWKSHVHPVCTTIVEFTGDYKYILMKDLYRYIPKHYTMNETIQKDMDPKVEEFFKKIKQGKDPLVALHRERDMWWLRNEYRAYSEILRTRQPIDPQDFNNLLKRSYSI